METKTVMMPRELTAENGAKALLIGEFHEAIYVTCPDCDGGEYQEIESDQCGTCNDEGSIALKATVSWSTIKEIYAKAVEHLGV